MKQENAAPEEELQPLAVLRLHWKKIFFICAGAILLVWGVAVVGDGLIRSDKNWVLAQASSADKRVSIEADVTFFRDEIVLPNSGGGTVVMRANAGEHVAKGQALAMVCGDGHSAEALTRQAALEQRLRWLEETNEAQHYHALNAEQLGRQADDTFSEFLKALDRGDCGALSDGQELFLHRSTTLEAALDNDNTGYASEIEAAKAQLAQLKQQASPENVASVPAPAAGDYYPIADGLESRLRPAALKEIMPAQMSKLLAAKANPEDSEGMGKLVTGFRWYAAALLKVNEAQQLTEGARYTVIFPRESAREFPMRVERIRRDNDNKAVVVLSCDEKDDTIHCLRGAKAEIVTDRVEGLRIPSAAIRFLDKGEGQKKRKTTGVYIVRMGKLHLREVDVLYQDREDAIVAWGNLKEAKAVEGDRFTVQGRIQSVTEPETGKLLIIGQDMTLTGENTKATSAVTGKQITVTTTKRSIYNETILTGKNLTAEQNGGVLVVTGEELACREQRGNSLRIHDSVLVEGRIGRNDPTTIPESS